MAAEVESRPDGRKIPRLVALSTTTAPQPSVVSPASGPDGQTKEAGSDVWLPATLQAPPPEDRLAGANAARGGRGNEVSPRKEVESVRKSLSFQPQVYLEGVDYMKDRIRDVHGDLNRIQCDYYDTVHADDDHFLSYLKTCDMHFLSANNDLRKRSVTLEVIDSETRLVSLLNNLREQDTADQETIRYLTEYWDNIKSTVERLKAVVDKFQRNVLNRLKMNYISDSHGDLQLEVCSAYREDISSYKTEIENTLANTQILLKSFHSGLHQDLFHTSRFTELMVVSCDLKAFPLLRLVADVVQKVSQVCDVALAWLARDSKFMYEIQSVIREARHQTRKREEDLRCQKEKQKRYEKKLKAANILLRTNRDKLHKLETELHVLEEHMDESERSRRHRTDQLQQKESMVDFLKLTLSQTKRNYSLQTKRSKLVKQVKDLKELLSTIERDLSAVQSEIQVKAEEKVRLSEKVEVSEKSYDVLQGDMDRFSSSLHFLETQVMDLSEQLHHLELIRNLKSSPETVEQIYDRPSTVKLAPSLKEKIKKRRMKGRDQ